MAKYHRARYHQEPEPKKTDVLGLLLIVVALLITGFAGSLAAIRLASGQPLLGGLPALPTANIVPQLTPAPAADPAPHVAATPIPGVAQNAATAQAQFDAAVQAGEHALPIPNTGQAAPAVLGQQAAEERHAAGDNVPTAEPVIQAESGGIFGSKPVLVDPQATHECKHGQIWVDGKGCRNP